MIFKKSSVMLQPCKKCGNIVFNVITLRGCLYINGYGNYPYWSCWDVLCVKCKLLAVFFDKIDSDRKARCDIG